MIAHVKWFLYTVILFLFLDGLWIFLVAKPMYTQILGEIFQIRTGIYAWGAIVIFYFLIVLGIVVLVPVNTSRYPAVTSAARGFLFGFISYAVFALTNYIILKAWTLDLVMLDVIWGGGLCMVTSLFYYFLQRRR